MLCDPEQHEIVARAGLKEDAAVRTVDARRAELFVPRIENGFEVDSGCTGIVLELAQKVPCLVAGGFAQLVG